MLVEALVTVVIIGILATVALAGYGEMRQQALRREADAYLQLMRQAALAHYQRWRVYPTSLNDLRPQAGAPSVIQVPEQANRLSSWAYCYASANPAQWSAPRALFKRSDGTLQGSYRDITAAGAISDAAQGADPAWLADEP